MEDDVKWQQIVAGIRSSVRTPTLAAISLIEFLEAVREKIGTVGGSSTSSGSGKAVAALTQQVTDLQGEIAALKDQVAVLIASPVPVETPPVETGKEPEPEAAKTQEPAKEPEPAKKADAKTPSTDGL